MSFQTPLFLPSSPSRSIEDLTFISDDPNDHTNSYISPSDYYLNPSFYNSYLSYPSSTLHNFLPPSLFLPSPSSSLNPPSYFCNPSSPFPHSASLLSPSPPSSFVQPSTASPILSSTPPLPPPPPPPLWKLPYVDGDKKKRKWTAAEDSLVLYLIEKYGNMWALIASFLNKRTGKQVRERYFNQLDPKIKKNKFSVEEDNMIMKLYQTMGPKWLRISQMLEGRTENSIKNRFYSCLTKKVGKVNIQRLESQNNFCGKKEKEDGDRIDKAIWIGEEEKLTRQEEETKREKEGKREMKEERKISWEKKDQKQEEWRELSREEKRRRRQENIEWCEEEEDEWSTEGSIGRKKK